MIIGIVDFPKRNHHWLIDELLTYDVKILSGSLEELKEKSQNLQFENPEKIIFWDYPALIEDGLAHEVDKILEIGYFYKALTPDEFILEESRSKLKHIIYGIFGACNIRDNTIEKYTRAEQNAKNHIKDFLTLWQKQASGSKDVFQDEFLLELAENIKNQHGLDVDMWVEGNYNNPYLARYIEKGRKIYLNAYNLYKRKIGPSNCKRLKRIIAHELGHATDTDLPRIEKEQLSLRRRIQDTKDMEEVRLLIPRYKDLVLKAESNAFDYGVVFLDEDNSVEDFEMDRENNRRSYLQLLEQFETRIIRKLNTTSD